MRTALPMGIVAVLAGVLLVRRDRHRPAPLLPIDLLRMVRQLVLELDVVAFDIMEVAPPYDHADITVNNAHRLIWEALAAMSSKARDAAG